MKNCLLVLVVLFALNVNAQQKSDSSNFFKGVEISTGFFLVPQGEISLIKAPELFKFATPLFFAILIKKDKLVLAPCYTFGNSVGLLIEYQLFKKLGMFLLGTKSVLLNVNAGKVGFALMTPLAGGKATGFVEYVMPFRDKKWERSLSVGVIVPFVTPLTKKKK